MNPAPIVPSFAHRTQKTTVHYRKALRSGHVNNSCKQRTIFTYLLSEIWKAVECPHTELYDSYIAGHSSRRFLA